MYFMRSILVCSCFVAYGCASTYEIPESVRKSSESMRPLQADDLLRRILPKNESGHGLCNSNGRHDRSAPDYMDLTNGVMVFSDYDQAGRAAREGQPTFELLDIHRKSFEFDFRKVSRVQVVSRNAITESCAKLTTNRQLGIQTTDGVVIIVDVPAGDFDSLLAAVLSLSPRARVAQGLGF